MRRENLKMFQGTAEVHLDQIRGSLIGGAIGDALGYAVELYHGIRFDKWEGFDFR